MHNKLVIQASNGIIDSLIITRKEASRFLGGQTSETDTAVPIRKRTLRAARHDALEQDSKAIRLLLQEIINKMNG